MSLILQGKGRSSAAATIQRRIVHDGEKYWRMGDFGDLPPAAVAQTLSRLMRRGALQRVGKGLYYRARSTALGQSRPCQGDILTQRLQMPLLLAGLTAANALGFTTQNPAQREYATTANAVALQTIDGAPVKIYTRRPEAWAQLSTEDAALLEFLRAGGMTSELCELKTCERLLVLLGEPERFSRLLVVSHTEPPRVRAMLGAIGQELQIDPAILAPIKNSLNPLSRFDFGMFDNLAYAKAWQAK